MRKLKQIDNTDVDEMARVDPSRAYLHRKHANDPGYCCVIEGDGFCYGSRIKPDDDAALKALRKEFKLPKAKVFVMRWATKGSAESAEMIFREMKALLNEEGYTHILYYVPVDIPPDHIGAIVWPNPTLASRRQGNSGWKLELGVL